MRCIDALGAVEPGKPLVPRSEHRIRYKRASLRMDGNGINISAPE